MSKADKPSPGDGRTASPDASAPRAASTGAARKAPLSEAKRRENRRRFIRSPC